MNEWELADDEYIKAANTVSQGFYLDSDDVSDLDRAIATAAQKKLVDYLETIDKRVVDTAQIAKGYGVLITRDDWDSIKATLGVK